MMAPLKPVAGALRMLSVRVEALHQFGLTLWTAAGEKALRAFASSTRDASHRAEVMACEVECEISRVVADGKVTASEIEELRKVLNQIKRIKEETHDLGEAVKL